VTFHFPVQTFHYTNRNFHGPSNSNVALPMLLRDFHSVHIDTVLEPPFCVRNLDVVAAHLPLSHPAVLRKRPVFEAVGSPPLAGLIVPFVPELYSDLNTDQLRIHRAREGKEGNTRYRTDLVLRESKQLLPQPIPILHGPLLAQEVDNLIRASKERVPVSPDGIRRVPVLHLMRIPTFINITLSTPHRSFYDFGLPSIPQILRRLHLNPSRLQCKRRERRFSRILSSGSHSSEVVVQRRMP
jgi:hypothetical protein